MVNLLRIALLLTLVTVLAIDLGWALGGRNGIIVASCLACLLNLGLYGASGSIVLQMHRALPLTEDEAPEVFEIVQQLAEEAGIPIPRLYLLPSASANIFAAGRGPGHAAIAVTHGLVGLLNQEELAGVLGHEVSHILTRDILLASAVAVLVGVLSRVASIFRGSFSWGGERDARDHDNPLPVLFFAVLMPFVAILIRLAIPISREWRADEGGARLCGNALYLASALRKIDAFSGRFPLRDAAPATAHLFITNPLPSQGWLRFFNSHPSLEERMARLEGMNPCEFPKKAMVAEPTHFNAWF